MAETKKSVFEILNAVNVNDKVEKKNNLSYVPWADAWGEVMKLYPDANYEVKKTPMGCNYWDDGRTCWVEVAVTIEGKTITEMLPVMDFRNNSIPLEKVTSVDVVKAIQRCATKCIARFGLGLYVYRGEDLPEEEKAQEEKAQDEQAAKTKAAKKTSAKKQEQAKTEYVCEFCKKPVTDRLDWGEKYTAENIAKTCLTRYGAVFCADCFAKKANEEREANNK